jgi:hypothetical protein
VRTDQPCTDLRLNSDDEMVYEVDEDDNVVREVRSGADRQEAPLSLRRDPLPESARQDPDPPARGGEANRIAADHHRFTDTWPIVLTTAEHAAIRALAADLPAV